MSNKIKHSFEWLPIFRSLETQKNIIIDTDITSLRSDVITYLTDLYDGFVYINNIPYQINRIIEVGIQKGIISNSSTIDGDTCKLCYGRWILKSDEDKNIDTNEHIDEEVDIYWLKYDETDIISKRRVCINKGIDANSFDIYLSYNIVNLIEQLNAKYLTSFDINTSLCVYLVISIDNYNGLLLFAGTNNSI